MLKNKILYSLLIVCVATLLNADNNAKLDEKLSNITIIRNHIKSGIANSSVQQLKGLTDNLIAELKSLPQYVDQDGDTLITIRRTFPVTTGVTSYQHEISKKLFFDEIHKIETLTNQATDPEQFNQIIKLVDDIVLHFVYNDDDDIQ